MGARRLMISTATVPARVTFVARECEVKITADHGSGRVRISVDGREAELSAGSALRAADKLREAVRRANA